VGPWRASRPGGRGGRRPSNPPRENRAERGSSAGVQREPRPGSPAGLRTLTTRGPAHQGRSTAGTVRRPRSAPSPHRVRQGFSVAAAGCAKKKNRPPASVPRRRDDGWDWEGAPGPHGRTGGPRRAASVRGAADHGHPATPRHMPAITTHGADEERRGKCGGTRNESEAGPAPQPRSSSPARQDRTAPHRAPALRAGRASERARGGGGRRGWGPAGRAR